MTCKYTDKILGDLLTTNGESTLSAEDRSHIDHCPVCRLAYNESRQTWSMLDNLEQATPAPALRMRTFNAVSATLKAPHAAVDAKSSRIKTFALPVVFGTLSAAISLALLYLAPIKLSTPGPTVTVIFLFWIALYAEVFRWLSPEAGNQGAISQWIARASLIAMSLFLVFSFLQPVPSCVAMCETATGSIIGSGVWLERNAFCLFGMLYAFLPTLFATVFSRSQAVMRPIIHGSAAGLAFLLISAPGIILQCPEWTAGIVVSWTVGALLGSLGGGTIGTWIKVRGGLVSG